MARKTRSKKIQTATGTETADGEMKHYMKTLPPRRHEPGAKCTFIVDGSNIAYQAHHAYKRISYQGQSVSMLFGVPMILKAMINMHKPAKLIIVWDGRRSKDRLALIPNYKGHRDKKRDPEERAKFIAQMKETRRLLKYLGITQVKNKDVEADDMIYKLAIEESKIRRVVIVSGDKDFSQLVNWDISVMNPRDKFSTTPFAFSCGHNGVLIDQFVDFLCLTGDSSDDIPGIPGIGPVRAAAFLKKFGSIENYLKDDNADFTGMMDKDKVKKVYERNRLMIDLKLFNDKYLKKVKPHYLGKKPNLELNYSKYMALCSEYNMTTLMTEAFTKVFKL